MKLRKNETTKSRGDFGEAAAAKYLQKQGFRIKERNLHIGRYEADIIAENRDFLVFVEVKSRTVPHLDKDGASTYAITPAMAVNKEKQRRLVSRARIYLGMHPTDKQPRLDVIEVYLKESGASLEVLKIHHIENAFGA